MRASICGRSGVLVIGMCAIASLGVSSLLMTGHDAFSGPPSGSKARLQGNGESGRKIFNGKGACYYCHGVDGHRDKIPDLQADTAALIARLSPPPADLRNANSLNVKTDQARARIIREGHEGTGMFPDTTLTDQEIADTVAYLALLRREGGGQDSGKGHP